jgi:hypothetical protein
MSRPGASVGLAKGIFAALRRQPPPIRGRPILLEAASLSAEGVDPRLRTGGTGLTTGEAEARLHEQGPNMVTADGRKSIGLLLWHAVINRWSCCLRCSQRFRSPPGISAPAS